MDAIKTLKKKVIEDFNKLEKRLDRGYAIENYQNILHSISFIQSHPYLKNRDAIYECLISVKS